jgi:hypothetical protein
MADDDAAPVSRDLFYELIHDLAALLPGSAEHKAEVAASIDAHQAEHDEAAGVSPFGEKVTAETTEGTPA